MKKIRRPAAVTTSFKGYLIRPHYYLPNQFEFAHEDYDGPEDHRLGSGASVLECVDLIEEQIEMDGLCRLCAGFEAERGGDLCYSCESDKRRFEDLQATAHSEGYSFGWTDYAKSEWWYHAD